MLLSGKVEAIKVHHLGPRRHEVLHKLLLGVGRSIDLCKRPQLGVRAEDEVHSRPSPLDLVPLPVTSFVDAAAAIGCIGRLPYRAHV